MEQARVPLWEQAQLRAAAGDTLRPGGFSLSDRAVEVIGMVPGWRVLDVGCGLGATVGRLRARFGVEAWGVEASATQIDRAHGISGIIQAYGDDLPFVADSFDALFCECVLSLLTDREQALEEFYRVLRPGGFLVLSDLYSSGTSAMGAFSCSGRAVPVSMTHAAVEANGFSVWLEEDHSSHLKDLAAKMIWAGEEQDGGWECDRQLGYYLMIAQKQGASHV